MKKNLRKNIQNGQYRPIADKAYIFDNSTQKPQLIATKDNGELKTEGTYIPQWYKTYVLDRLT